MSNKQSSIEWLDNEFASSYFDYLTGLIDNKEFNERHKVMIEQAKAMHKEEIKETARTYFHECSRLTPEQYYNETFEQ